MARIYAWSAYGMGFGQTDRCEAIQVAKQARNRERLLVTEYIYIYDYLQDYRALFEKKKCTRVDEGRVK
jgi:hypothetical protein